MTPPSPDDLSYWKPDLLWTGGRFEAARTLVVDGSGRVVRISGDPADAAKAT